MRKFPKALAGIGVGAVLAVGSFASANFLLHGSGDATGSIASPTNPNVSGTITEALWPGDCSDVTVTFANPDSNKHAVDITNVLVQSAKVDKVAFASLVKPNWNVDPHPANGVLTASNGFVVQPGSSTDITIPNGVCLSPDAGSGQNGADTYQLVGESVTANVQITSNVVAGTEYNAAVGQN